MPQNYQNNTQCIYVIKNIPDEIKLLLDYYTAVEGYNVFIFIIEYN